METDANGDAFNPDTKNIMSYSMKGCRSYFTKEQLARMYAYYMTVKSYLACGNDTDNLAEKQPVNKQIQILKVLTTQI